MTLYRRKAVPTGPEVEISDEMRDGVYIRRPGDEHWVLVLREKFEREYEPVPSEGADVTIPARRYLEGISNAAHHEASLKLADELAEELAADELPGRARAALSKYLESRRGR